MTRLALAAFLIPGTAMAHAGSVPHDHGIEGMILALAAICVAGAVMLRARR